MKKQVTVLITSEDETAFKGIVNQLKQAFPAPEGAPWSVGAMSVDNEFHRLELLEEAIEQGDISRARELISMTGEVLNEQPRAKH